MTALIAQANEVYSDFVIPGVSSSGFKEPIKSEVRSLWSTLDVMIGSLGVNGAIDVKKATRALLYADLAHPADTLAIVYDDPTDDYNGIYAKSGISGAGAWSLTSIALPSSFADDIAAVMASLENLDVAVAAAQAAEAGAENWAGQAAASQDAAVAALTTTGITRMFDTKALAVAGLAGVSDGDLVMIFADESEGGGRTLYVKQSGALVFKAQIGGPQRYHAASGNLFNGSLASALNDNTAGTKNGDLNTGFGVLQFTVATTSYACAAFGYGALTFLTTGHSTTALGYQAGHQLTTGSQNVLIGVDAAYISTTITSSVVIGHHCVNQANFTGTGLIAIGQQTARFLTGGDYIIAIGRNAMANSPATGSAGSIVIGGAAAIAASVSNSIVIGQDAVAVAGVITDSIIIGKFAQYGGGAIGQNVLVGVDSMFRAAGGGGDNNSALGFQTGHSVAGAGNLFLGYRAGYQSINTTINGSVVIGNLAGFNDLASNELVIANTDGAAAVLIRGDFSTGDVTIRNIMIAKGDQIRIQTAKTPASAGATGTAGSICWDASFVYVCTAANTWKRAAIATW